MMMHAIVTFLYLFLLEAAQIYRRIERQLVHALRKMHWELALPEHEEAISKSILANVMNGN